MKTFTNLVFVAHAVNSDKANLLAILKGYQPALPFYDYTFFSIQ
jgi:hypothetical protein